MHRQFTKQTKQRETRDYMLSEIHGSKSVPEITKTKNSESKANQV